jgi:MerR family transcriptional regulator, light-induced transcriptional regulator
MYSIKQLSVLTGIKPHTIRVWEKRYNMFTPTRTDTNIRRYSEEDIKLALNIKMLLSIGYRISRIGRMTAEEMGTIITKGNKYVGQPPVPESLLSAAINLDKSAFISKINKFIDERGLEWTYENLIVPFQMRIGLLWQSGGIIPAQEHFTSNIIRDIIVKATSDLQMKETDKSSILFYLPEGEHHELALLYFNYIACKEGFSTTYLGQNVPLQDVIDVAQKQNINHIFSSFTVSVSENQFNGHISRILSSITNVKFFVTGYQIEVKAESLPDELHKISSASQFKQLLK